MTIDASTQPAASPIVRVLNEEVRHYHRWCTPSILVDQERIEDFYASDVSISAGFFGTLVDHTGVFGEAERFAAAAQGADRTMFSVHGSSGSNFIVLRMLALERPDALVLVARNCHHSTINAIKAFGLDFRFLPSPYDAEFEAVLPPRVDQVVDGAAALPGGARGRLHVADLRGAVRQHATRSPRRSTTRRTTRCCSSTRRGAGTCTSTPSCRRRRWTRAPTSAVQSTHKLAGGLQQTGLIHWREGRVDSELMEEAFREYVTTRPSYHLLASADAAVRSLAATGRDALGACIGRTRGAEGAAARAAAAAAPPRRPGLGRAATTPTSRAATRSRRRSR